MSILLGVQTDYGSLASEITVRQQAIPTARYAIGAETVYVKGRIGMVWQPYGCHPRFKLESGPVADELGNVLSLDGRLDNFRELAARLDMPMKSTSDSRIALEAFARWDTECFRKFTGDWAIVLWNSQDDRLFLARDHAGTRTLYYRQGAKALEWATHLDSLISGTDASVLSETYVAAYLCGQPIRELTPYKDVFAVSPGSVLTVQRGGITRERHWSAFGESELHYRSEQEYDEEFLARFQQSVARRTEDSSGVIAELSGGMDSTAIVCMSDRYRRIENSCTPLLDTLSYFDDEEISLDERRYFSATEAQRGKVGTHLDMAFSQRTLAPHDAAKGRYLLPGADSLSINREEQLYERVWSKGHLAVLSGIGGDELLGGVPDRYPELAGYLMTGAWKTLATQSLAWSLVNRDPLLETLVHTVRWTVERYSGSRRAKAPPPWISRKVRELTKRRDDHARSYHKLQDYTVRQLDNDRVWWAVMETLPHCFPRILARPEYRYPYLDKDLANYLLRVPASQLLRPGRRRAMMRRALTGIVPQEILERKRKAFQRHALSIALQRSRESLHALFDDSLLEQANFIQPDLLKKTLESGERKAVAAREETSARKSETNVSTRYRRRGIVLEKPRMPTLIPRHLGFKRSRYFQPGRKHGAIGKLDTDFRAVDAVFIDGEAADDFSDEFLTDDH